MVLNATTAATLGVLGVLAVGGGTVVAAQQAEPGDFLYPLRASVMGDADLNMEADLEALEAAYDEAATLEADGELTADVRADLSERYALHLNNVLEAIANLEAEGNTEAAAELRTRLRTSLREVGSFFDDDASASADASVSGASSVMTSSAASSTDGSVNVDVNADASADVNVEAENGEDVRIREHDSETERYESEDGSVRINSNAEATSTVNINQD